MKLFLSFLLLVLSTPLFSQDPGTAINMYILKNGEIVSKDELKKYHVSVNYFHTPQLETNDDRTFFWRLFAWHPYREETYRIQIVNEIDTMRIDLKMDLRNNKKANHESTLDGERRYLFNVCFTIEVPFAKGYYVVDKFVPGSWEIEYKLAPGFKWVNKK